MRKIVLREDKVFVVTNTDGSIEEIGPSNEGYNGLCCAFYFRMAFR